MDLTIIAAVSENNVIGLDGEIPWYIPKDLKRFKRLTQGHPVIMGRLTYDSILDNIGKPLPNRKNIVLSRTIEEGEGMYVARGVEEAVELTNGEDSYVIGGERVYREFLPLATIMELTRVHEKYEGDTFFPEVNWGNWDLINMDIRRNDNLSYSFLTYNRR